MTEREHVLKVFEFSETKEGELWLSLEFAGERYEGTLTKKGR